MKELYIQYGCGLSAPKDWVNFDSSPTLQIQKIPLLGSLIKARLNTVFPKNVLYGDIVKGLPVKDGSAKAVYCSHVLEHLSLTDFRIALKNTYKILKPGGVFRCVVPDLEVIVKNYVKALDERPESASISFVGNDTLLGTFERPRGKNLLTSSFGNARHLWMWDHYSLGAELQKAGFTSVRRAKFNDSRDSMFSSVESKERFEHAVALECQK